MIRKLLFTVACLCVIQTAQADTVAVSFYAGTIYEHTKTYDSDTETAPTDPGFAIAGIGDLTIDGGAGPAIRAAGAFDGNANVGQLTNYLNGVGSVSTYFYASDPKKDDYEYLGETYDLSTEGKGILEVGYLVSDPLNTPDTDRSWMGTYSGELNFDDGPEQNEGQFGVTILQTGTYAFTLKASSAFAVYLFEDLAAGYHTFNFDTRYTLGGAALSNSFHVFELEASPAPVPVPEPSTIIGLTSMGLFGLIGLARRRRRT